MIEMQSWERDQRIPDISELGWSDQKGLFKYACFASDQKRKGKSLMEEHVQSEQVIGGLKSHGS